MAKPKRRSPTNLRYRFQNPHESPPSDDEILRRAYNAGALRTKGAKKRRSKTGKKGPRVRQVKKKF